MVKIKRFVFTITKMLITLIAVVIPVSFSCVVQARAYGEWRVLTLWAREANGLTIENESNPGDARLFDVTKMTPGDISYGTIRVKNECSFSFTLKSEVKDILPDAVLPSLAKKFKIEAYIGPFDPQNIDPAKKLGDFPTQMPPGNPSVIEYDFQSTFLPGTTTDVTFVISLDGPFTGNEYQDKPAKLQWIFTAERAESPVIPGPGGSDGSSGFDRAGIDYTLNDSGAPLTGIEDAPVPLAGMPATGEPPLWHYTLTGSLLAFLGVFMLVRERRQPVR